MKNLFLSLNVLLLIACSCAKQQDGVFLVKSDKFEEQLKKAKTQIIDVRTPEEYAEGHIENAQNFNVNNPEFNSLITTLDKEKLVMVYCKSGGRSAQATSILKENGFKLIYELDGGIIEWNDANKPIKN